MPSIRRGAACWLLVAPFFLVANVAVGRAWRHPPYRWTTHNISDLGNVGCGWWDPARPREVCSPWHHLMNGAFVATGVLLALGVLLTWSALGRGAATRCVQSAVLAAGGGYVLAGAYPADVNEDNHVLGALLIFVVGNGGLLAAALAGRGTVLGQTRGLSLALGVTGLAGTVLFLAGVDAGFGVGGMERVAVFPLFVWVAGFGLRLLVREPEAAVR
ncbi:DUF998 domain-containing protein [Micromonospora sp. URMC 106]|uniref:DUF998 domain-containing protein n=1 Tax=Micromonospora sp. URMC 106 TaxID=3423408 RepID=UPI003F1C51BE